ncbi:MAG: 30S ribosome-binding factor RbfA [Bacteroidota bacterium]|nr:30S ribosome-binding factor RbfA [Bacteroidota bacterium]
MNSVRQNQIAELIRRNFSMVLTAEGSYIYGSQVLVTVTGVKMTPDLALAKIYLSVFNVEHKQEILLQMEQEHLRLKQSLYHRIKKQLRIMPELKFYLDDTLDEVYKLDALFKKMKDENRLGKEEAI